MIKLVGGTWTQFDFVRTKLNGWGSTGHTPYIKYTSHFPQSGASFGYSVANIGDIDGNGVEDIVVGAPGESFNYTAGATQQFNAGGVYVLLMQRDGTLRNMTHINGITGGGPQVLAGDQFGFSLCGLGDLDGDGVPDMGVGAPSTILSGVYVLFMRSNATVRESVLIRGRFIGTAVPTNSSTVITANSTAPAVTNDTSTANAPSIHYGSRFGTSLANIGDFNGDGCADLAVGAIDSSSGHGFVYLLLLRPNATVLNYTTIGAGIGGGPGIASPFPGFGSAVVLAGDLDRDNVSDLAIGAQFLFDDGTLNPRAGVTFVCLMHANGTVKHTERISEFAQRARGDRYMIKSLVSGCDSVFAKFCRG